MLRKVLLIVAAGKSTRFGGFPKAFCCIGERTIIENTIIQSKDFYDKVYIGVNKDTFARYADKIKEGEMFSIIMGQGDAHSLLKCLSYIKKRENNIRNITVCWGDAIFVDSTPFEELLVGFGSNKVAVACSKDRFPYAWFDIDTNNEIIKSHFALKDGVTKIGLHDQSLFIMDFEFAFYYLNKYRESLGIPYENNEICTSKKEMKLLLFFEFLYVMGYEPAKCVEITPEKVLSFNTNEELKLIKRKMGIKEK